MIRTVHKLDDGYAIRDENARGHMFFNDLDPEDRPLVAQVRCVLLPTACVDVLLDDSSDETPLIIAMVLSLTS